MSRHNKPYSAFAIPDVGDSVPSRGFATTMEARAWAHMEARALLREGASQVELVLIKDKHAMPGFGELIRKDER